MASPRFRLALALMAFAGAAPGCGGAEPSREEVLRQAKATGPQMKPNPADVDRAQSILIRSSDLISVFRRDPEKRASPGIPHCPGLYMPDRSGVTITGSAVSHFTNGGDGIASSAALFKTKADLRRYWRAVVRPAYADCLAEQETHVKFGTRVKIVDAAPIQVTADGVDRVAGYRIRVRKKRLGSRLWVDVFRTVALIGHGRAMVNIQTAEPRRLCNCIDGLATRVAQRLIAAGQR